MKFLDSLDVSTKIVESANKEITLHPDKKEYSKFIPAVAFLRWFTIVLAGLASYSYFYQGLFPAVKSHELTVIIALVLGIGLEIVAAFVLKKMFKFTFRKRFQKVVFFFLASVIFYGASFYTTTNGLAQRQAANKDNTEGLVGTKETERKAIETKYVALVKDVDSRIERIERNPQGWSEGKRTHLTAGQLRDVRKLGNQKDTLYSNLDKELLTLNSEYENKLKANRSEMHAEAKKYHGIMAFVMFFNLLFTAILMFFLTNVRMQEAKDSVINEDMKFLTERSQLRSAEHAMSSYINSMNRIDQNMSFVEDYETLHQKQIAAKLETYIRGLSNGNEQELSLEELDRRVNKELSEEKYQREERRQNSEKQPVPDRKEKKQPVKVGGFNTENSFENKTHKNAQLISYPNTYGDDYFKKHGKIVRAIVKNNVNENPLTNQTVNKIISDANGAVYKSAGTVKTVYRAMQAVGIDKFDTNGNIVQS